MKSATVALAVFIGTTTPAVCEFDTSSYSSPYQAPSVLDNLGQMQRLQIQRQQIELQRIEIERQKLQLRQADVISTAATGFRAPESGAFPTPTGTPIKGKK